MVLNRHAQILVMQEPSLREILRKKDVPFTTFSKLIPVKRNEIYLACSNPNLINEIRKSAKEVKLESALGF